MNSAVLLQVVLTCWLWPFADGQGDRVEDAETIASLRDRTVVIPAEPAAEVSTQTALEQYKKYLQLPAANPAARLEAMRRLGDLNLAAGETKNINDPAYIAGMAYHREAITLYEQLLANNADYSEADKVMYQLSRAYESAGQPDAALEVLNRLVSKYPQSRFIGEAQFRRGEMLFVRKDYAAAADAFAIVMQSASGADYFQQSLYKYGWAQFKLGEYEMAIDAFTDLLDRRMQVADADPSGAAVLASMSRPERELVDDTLRVLSLSFAYLDGPQSIAGYLDKHSGSRLAYLLYASLGDLYLAKERYLDAADAYAGYVARQPDDQQAPVMSMQIIAAYRAGRLPSLVLQAKEDYVDAYGLDSHYWLSHDPQSRPDVVLQLKQNLSDLAQYDHALAQKTATPEAYAQAANWYKRYLQYFPDDPDSAQRCFLLGEILMESQQYAEANQYYVRAAYGYTDYERAAEAAYAGLLAAQAQASRLQGQEQSDWQATRLQQALRFATAFPTHDEAGPVLSNAAEQFFATNQLEAALAVAGELIGRHLPDQPELDKVAWTVAAHGHFELHQYKRAELAYRELRRTGGTDELAGIALDDRIAAAIYRQAEQLQANGDIGAAVTDYLRIESDAPLSAIKSSAVYDAAALLIQQQEWDQAIPVLTHYRSTYRQSKRGDQVTQKLAVAYQKAGQPLAAAQEFEKIAVMPALANDLHREALWQSAELYEKADDLAAARRSWKEFVGRFPQPLSESIEVRQRLANLAGRVGDARDRGDWLKSIIDADAQAGDERNERSKTLAALAALELAEPSRLAFNAVQLKAPLTESLKLKKKRMEQALSAYDSAAAYGVAEVTSVATYRIARLYQQLGASLMDSERPAELSTEELDQYEILLEEQAFPFEEKAIELFEINASRALDGVYDEWIAKSYARLAQLMPARYAKYEKAEDHVATLL